MAPSSNAAGKRSFSSQSTTLGPPPITDTTRRLTQLLDGPKKKKKRRLNDAQPPRREGLPNTAGGNATAGNRLTAAATSTQRWSHLAPSRSKLSMDRTPASRLLGGVTLAAAPGFKKATATASNSIRRPPPKAKAKVVVATTHKSLDAQRKSYNKVAPIVAKENIVAAANVKATKPVVQAGKAQVNSVVAAASKPSTAAAATTTSAAPEPVVKPSVCLFARKTPRGRTRSSSSWTRPNLHVFPPPLAPPLDKPAAAANQASTNATPATGKVGVFNAVSIPAATETQGQVPPVAKKPRPLRDLSALGPIPKPAQPTDDSHADTAVGGAYPTSEGKHKASAGNFVRQNLRNGAGACRGARNKGKKSKWQLQREQRQQEWVANQQKKNPFGAIKDVVRGGRDGAPLQNGVDPMDDFLDGTFQTAPVTKAQASREAIPKCPGHQRPCKLLTVKKNTTGNKGRPFYVCSLPRGEQCNHFTWADDTVEATRRALLKNSSHSGFIARQVASYMERLKCLTVPELRVVADRHDLSTTGKKQQLLTRLSIWVRDEIADGTGEYASEELETMIDDKEGEEPKPVEDGNNESYVEGENHDSLDDESSDESNEDVSSDEELELFGEQPTGKASNIKSHIDSDDESDTGSVKDRSAMAKTACPLRSTLQKLFGHDDFRKSQEWTVQRCLGHKRTLLVAPTGFGKSLCYSLPAAMMEGVCIVISPLLSLIQDQLRVLPPRLPAATLSGPMSTASMAATLDDVVRGRLKVLFVSPERLTSSAFRRMFIPRWNPETKMKERSFPTVALLCVDEAHCMSTWGANFRPSYLRMRAMTELIQPQSVLAITATAGPRVVGDICRSLGINGSADSPPESLAKDTQQCDGGVRVMKSDRDNIDVSCMILSNQVERLSKLMKVLTKAKGRTKGERAAKTDIDDGCLAKGSVIVYVWRQRDAEAVAENIQASGVDGGVVVYHGGMDSGARSRSQSMFMRGKARICVATVAFGLGINKGDIAGVIHLYLSASPEHYLQEIGRAGRDGRPARAIALVLSEEVLVRHSLAHSDLISKSQIRKLLSLLDARVKGALTSLSKERPEYGPINVALPLQKSVLDCDCKSETIETLISILEQNYDKESLVRLEGNIYDHATIAPKRRTLDDLSKFEDVIKAILESGTCIEAPAGEKLDAEEIEARDESGKRKLIGFSYGSYTFSVAECANHLGPTAEPRHVYAALRRLQSSGEIELELDTSPIGRGLHMKLTKEGLTAFSEGNDSTLNELAADTLEYFGSTVTFAANKVLDLHNILQQVSRVPRNNEELEPGEKSENLQLFQNLIHEFFKAEGEGKTLDCAPDDLPEFSDVSIRELSLDIGSVLSHLLEIQGSSDTPRPLQLDDSEYTDYAALAITKFLHGIAPAGTSLSFLRRHALFGRMQSTQFTLLQEAVVRLLGSYK